MPGVKCVGTLVLTGEEKDGGEQSRVLQRAILRSS